MTQRRLTVAVESYCCCYSLKYCFRTADWPFLAFSPFHPSSYQSCCNFLRKFRLGSHGYGRNQLRTCQPEPSLRLIFSFWSFLTLPANCSGPIFASIRRIPEKISKFTRYASHSRAYTNRRGGDTATYLDLRLWSFLGNTRIQHCTLRRAMLRLCVIRLGIVLDLLA